ncbi:putative Type I inositol polyphosphate 5-phosphatase [Quillaja saponaria]|uniref:Type I inositol polyphosphate 5-phosphatase n=1 Tax=Quillaja saponaria TaxID=32244 RepID=A0AAD7KMX3_QUISA|nr:putative Type I inositol polyphosphate 5-phosphatase [Quillaja saponaria]
MRGTQGEVIWPRLVANKILRKGWGSSNFVADFPSNRESLLDTTRSESFDHDQTCLNSNSILYHHQDIHKYKVFVSTWNVGGIEPKEDLKLEDLLDTSSTTCDIYVLGFQEIVPLKASNVLGTENTKISTKWNFLIREALNKKRPTGRQDEAQQSQTLHEDHSKKNVHNDKNMHPNTEGKSIEISTAPQDFQCIISKQMVGILISVWVRGHLRPFIRYPNVDCVGCGIMGCLGNKGSVSARFQLHETNFCFVCSHLASGDRKGDEKIRNSNVAEIFSRTSFPGQPLLDLPRKILDHDQVIFLGDLNYRISSAEDLTRFMVKKKDWNALLKKDQLRMELINGDTLRNWH